MCYTTSEVKQRVLDAVAAYNAQAPSDARIARVSLFGSYASGEQNDDSDVDLLVRFSSPVVSLFTLARVMEVMEQALNLPVDVVQDPLPKDALLEIHAEVPLYEAA